MKFVTWIFGLVIFQVYQYHIQENKLFQYFSYSLGYQSWLVSDTIKVERNVLFHIIKKLLINQNKKNFSVIFSNSILDFR